MVMTMKKYKYIPCRELENYDGWEIVKIIDGTNIDMAVIMCEEESTQVEEIIDLQLQLEKSKNVVNDKTHTINALTHYLIKKGMTMEEILKIVEDFKNE